MRRLIDIQPTAQGFPPALTVQVGDLLMFGASGGHLRSDGDTVEFLGAFRTSVLGTAGRVLSPLGAPGTVLFLARQLGRATIDVITGDPWHEPHTSTIQLVVDQ